MNKLLYQENQLKVVLALIFVTGNGLLFAPAGTLPKAMGLR
jgi:hypothetical protein